jgi:hypothetical protein
MFKLGFQHADWAMLQCDGLWLGGCCDQAAAADKTDEATAAASKLEIEKLMALKGRISQAESGWESPPFGIVAVAVVAPAVVFCFAVSGLSMMSTDHDNSRPSVPSFARREGRQGT